MISEYLVSVFACVVVWVLWSTSPHTANRDIRLAVGCSTGVCGACSCTVACLIALHLQPPRER